MEEKEGTHVTGAETPLIVRSLPSCCRVRHRPISEQSLSHASRLHAGPVKPSSHSHLPFV